MTLMSHLMFIWWLTCFFSAVWLAVSDPILICPSGGTSLPLAQWTNSRWRCRDELSLMVRLPSSSSCDHQLALKDAVWASCCSNTKLLVHTGGTRRKAGASRESVCPSTSLPSVSPPPSPPPPPLFFLHPWCSIFCWEAFLGRGSGIVFWDQWANPPGVNFQSALIYCVCSLKGLQLSTLVCVVLIDWFWS